MAGRVHVVGAGVAGLSAATALAECGFDVIVYEAAPHAGGRCRSFHDEELGTAIDNGNHLVLSGNSSVRRYIERIGASGRLRVSERATYPFVDLAARARWTLDLGRGRWPTWLFSPAARVPGTGIMDYLACRRVLSAKAAATVGETLSNTGTAYDRFWRPLALAVLNTPPDEAAVTLLAPVLRETVLAGGRSSRPMIAPNGLSDAIVDPAIRFVSARGGQVVTGARLRAIECDKAGITSLRFSDTDVRVGSDERVVLALPPWVAADLLPDLTVPDRFEPIVNVHFAVEPGRIPASYDGVLTGVLGGLAEWVMVRGSVVSVTVSAARNLVEWPSEEVAAALWRDVAAVIAADQMALPAFRVIKERRATFSQSPEQCLRRPPANAVGNGVVLAGDWTATDLPATIEGAVRSGETAARRVSAE